MSNWGKLLIFTTFSPPSVHLHRVATTQGKQGIRFLLFPDTLTGKTQQVPVSEQNSLTQGKYLDCDY